MIKQPSAPATKTWLPSKLEHIRVMGPDRQGSGGVSPVSGTFMAMIELGRFGFDVPAKRSLPDRGIANCPKTISEETVYKKFNY
jgi:hypothetical protein